MSLYLLDETLWFTAMTMHDLMVYAWLMVGLSVIGLAALLFLEVLTREHLSEN